MTSSSTLLPTISPALQSELERVANSIRGLSIDGVEAAKSGHPGLPLGAAQIAAYLYGAFLDHYPQAPRWLARDRFILSAGHGSMLLYSSLHLSGFKLPLEELKRFRQLGSKTPGHPEYDHTEGVETTTGPLGQGIGAAVGQAMGIQLTRAHLDLPADLYYPKVVALAGDGCMMEGISHEACALAGHLNLDNLILIYDANEICLDGPLSECASEDVKKRFEGYGWDVKVIDGHNWSEIHAALAPLKETQTKPTLIIAHTVIGYGSPGKHGNHEAHGSPLGTQEAQLTKAALGLTQELFYVDRSVEQFFKEKLQAQHRRYSDWLVAFDDWKKQHPETACSFEAMMTKSLPQDLEASLRGLVVPASVASRASSNLVIQYLCSRLPWIVGGSADLSCSDSTWIKGQAPIAAGSWKGRNIKYGVREFAMASSASGIYQSQTWVPFVGTFLTFSDYMRNAIRLSAMMHVQVIYQFTHDSIFLGEDGPTHQPVEHLIALRAIPGLHVIRPGDAHEVAMAWLAALKYQGATALILSRQALPTLEGTALSYDEGMGRGAYTLYEPASLDWVILATGSELSLALEVSQYLGKEGIGARVVSMPCWELFDKQDDAYRLKVLGPKGTSRLSLEAGSTLGWHKYLGEQSLCVGIDHFGQSAPIQDLKQFFGFNVEAIVDRMKRLKV